ncbi:hypothetical protein LAJ19_16340 (plasmid) [Deinococcus taeanensis]|uniref:hypothetical protein n=1 Tax=Deinococcus taeanensis TaxID=2737050 RepID=UPI001CDC7BFC|nr:hypothetical protein [Deinococcus taeanensis]UBV44725.1 hypothetical protein LAJ19_16340 [Deinococcus taeanensis]
MSATFELSPENLRAALDRLNLPVDETNLVRAGEVSLAEYERITSAALSGADPADRMKSAMDELVAVLSETLGAGG